MMGALLRLLFAALLYFRCYATDNICKLPVSQGPCDQALMRWHYNSGTKQCEKFVYGGCEGNANNFLSKQQCEATCSSSGNRRQSNPPFPLSIREVPSIQCHLPMDQGPCKDILFRWYYNRESLRCEKFVYGGCFGNENNFVTKEMCEAVCLNPVPAGIAPAVPKVPCDDYPRIWFFNNGERKCEENCQLCSLSPKMCYRSKLECLQNRSPKDVICLTLSDGFHIMNPKQKCSRHYFSCLDGVFTEHTCPDDYRFDVSTNVCRPPELVAACQFWPFMYGL